MKFTKTVVSSCKYTCAVVKGCWNVMLDPYKAVNLQHQAADLQLLNNKLIDEAHIKNSEISSLKKQIVELEAGQ
jgi:hypothetical protein